MTLAPEQALRQTAFDRAIAGRETGNYKGAILVLQGVLVSKPNDLNALALLAQLLSLDKRDGPAWVALNAALAIDPNRSIAQRNYARLLMKQQRLTEASKAALAAYQADRQELENVLVMAATLMAGDQTIEAIRLIIAALCLRPSYAEALALRAGVQHRSDDLVGALLSAQRSLTLKPHLKQLWGTIGSLRYKVGDLSGAIEALEKAHQSEPDTVDHLINLGEFQREAGQLAAAVAALRRASATAPGNAGAWVNLGTVLQTRERVFEAKTAYARALTISPDQPEIANNLGALARDAEDWDEALRYFDQALRHQPNHASILSNRAAALNELGKFQDAEQAARQAILTDRRNVAGYVNLAAAQWGLGAFDAAVRSYRQALEMHPNLSEALLGLGYVLMDLDRHGEAEEIFKKIVSIDKNNNGLEAGVYLAIINYIKENFKNCRELLLLSQPILSSTKMSRRSFRVYWRYIDRLLIWRDSHRPSDQSGHTDLLHMIGDSHSLSSQGLVVRYQGENLRCSAEWIPGCKQWHLGNDKANQYKCKFESIMGRLPKNSKILMMIGEIDCRHDEGIIQFCKKNKNVLIDDIIYSTIKNYINYILKINKIYYHNIIISGVPCTNFIFEKIPEQELINFINFVGNFNNTLKKCAIYYGFDFLDVYAMTDRGDGISDGSWHIDEYHLLPNALSQAFDRHCCSPDPV